MKIIGTQEVNCKDCHRCLRSCPVKAIGIKEGRARVIEEKCILCGKCVTDCPQHAKQVTSRLDNVKRAIVSKRKVIMSLAPSFVSSFPEYTPSQLVNRIQSLGVSQVEETVVGASIISQLYQMLYENSPQTVISACCPVIVDVIKKYYPNLVDYIAPIVSPMIAHGKLLKQRFGEDAFIVFAGPCIAKISEGDQQDSQMDAIITFEQLRTWLEDSSCSDGGRQLGSENNSDIRYFPISGGILKSFMAYDAADPELIAVDGIEKCMEVLESLSKQEINPRFIEALACAGGCIGGPASGCSKGLPAKRVRIIQYARNAITSPIKSQMPEGLDFSYSHKADPVVVGYPSEAEIREILHQTGKVTIIDEKNCGACGYNTCREKAIAVYQGVAETDMCVPYMRSKAESFANIIVENSLNAIFAVNEKMIIQEFNPVVKRMFSKDKEIKKGARLTDFIDCTDFIAAARFGYKVIGKRVEYPLYGIITEQMIVPVQEHHLVIAIISDVTEQDSRSKEWQRMKEETVKKSTEIINKQMSVAQQIAGLLGETTAETKSALLELMGLLKGKEGE